MRPEHSEPARLRTRCLIAVFVALALAITTLALPPGATASNGALSPPSSTTWPLTGPATESPP